jgi:hypothetical protein
LNQPALIVTVRPPWDPIQSNTRLAFQPDAQVLLKSAILGASAAFHCFLKNILQKNLFLNQHLCEDQKFFIL